MNFKKVMNIKKVRKFDGKEYIKHYAYAYRTLAEREAERIRNKGYSVRMSKHNIKDSGMWFVLYKRRSK